MSCYVECVEKCTRTGLPAWLCRRWCMESCESDTPRSPDSEPFTE